MNKLSTQLIKLFLPFSIVGSILFSCETVIDVDLPDHIPALVLNSYFGTDTTFIVSLHQSKGILDGSYDFKSVQGATIELYAEDQLVGTFTKSEVESEYGIESGAYVLNHYPEAGVNYSIIASKTGYQTVEAQDAIPLEKTNPVIEKLESKMDEYNYPIHYLTYSMIDLPGEDYYEVLLYANVPRYDYYEDEDTSYYYQNGYWKNQIYYSEVGAELNEFEDSVDPSLFTDELFDGRKFTNTIEIYYGYGGDWNEDSPDNYKSKFSLEVRHVSESYYRYKVSLRLQQDTQGNPFAEAAPVYNNINGGFGIFAGYNREIAEYEFTNE